MIRAALLLMIAALCHAQTADAPPAFEVASVKHSPPPEGGMMRVWTEGGPGTGDPTRITYHNMSMSNLLCSAYGLAHYQVSGPSWMDMENFDIAAKVPPGATKDQLKVMLQNLLADRFKLAVHHESREFPMYFLSIGKGGSKLKPHVEKPPAASADDSNRPLKLGADGYPDLPSGTGMAIMRGRARLSFKDKEVSMLVGQIGGQLGAPVKDETGLTGRYDFDLYWSSANEEDRPDFIAAVQEQLGLKLEKRKAPTDFLVVDHVERVPTAN